MRDFKATVQGCMEALEHLETVKRPLPVEVFRLVCETALYIVLPLHLVCGSRCGPFRRDYRDTSRRIAYGCIPLSDKLASSSARNCDTNCDTVEAVLNLCLRHSQISETSCDTVEVVLYLCMRHSLRMQDLELARGCEEALQQLEALKRPFLLDVLHSVFKSLLSHQKVQHLDTARKIDRWYRRRTRFPLELASSCARNCETNCDTVEAMLYLRIRMPLFQTLEDYIEMRRGFKKVLQQLGTVQRPLPSSSCASICDTNCGTLEAVLYLCLRHSLRMHDFELARVCEEALQQLETVERPLPRDVLRLVYKPPSHQNHGTLRRSAISDLVGSVKLVREIVTQMFTEV